jgi:1,4-alpha-glucan branching enzyme
MVTFNSKTRKTIFQMQLPDAKTVSVVGTFNNWDPEKNVMKKGKSGIWKSEMKLEAGDYQFLYYADQTLWINDENCPRIKSDVGTENSVFTVEALTPKKKATGKTKTLKKK